MNLRPFLNLNTGITLAVFHSVENCSDTTDMLKIFVKDCVKAGAAAKRTLAEILSIPVAFELDSLLISLYTFASFTG